jgi:diguanylate cyclase (GGDEF)-like protein
MAEGRRPAAAETSAAPRRILVVDDDDTVRESLSDYLEFHDYAVTAVASAGGALEAVAQGEFDLVISDLVMPGMDGLAMIKAMRAAGREVPLLVMTGYASIEHAVESMKAGASDFITKPLKLDHVVLVVQRVLETAALRRLAGEREYYKELSISDGLTHVANYRHFNHVLQQEVERQRRFQRPLTLLLLDIDDFKKVNDRHGHLLGDLVLVKVASLLRDEVRGFDFVARYGGDEFTVILPEIAARSALAAGRRIIRSIGLADFRSPEGIDAGPISVTVGIASFPKDAGDALQLVAMADRAMYAGKKAGKNCLCVSGDEGNIIHPRLPTPRPEPGKD